MSNCSSCNQLTMSEALNDKKGASVSVYYNEVKDKLEEFSANVLLVPQLTDEEKVILGYNTELLNSFIHDQIQLLGEDAFVSQFPYVKRRIDQIPIISEVETNELVSFANLTPFSFPTLFTKKPETSLLIINNFFSPSGSISSTSTGSFCSLVPNIFAQFDEIQSKINNIRDYFTNAQQILSQIQDFSATALLETLKAQLLSAVDRIIANFLAKLEMITPSFLKNSEEFPYNTVPISDNFRRMRDRAKSFTSKNIVTAIKGSIEGLINQAITLFDVITFGIEEAKFIIFRFCQFISNVENFFDGLLQPLDDMKMNYEVAFKRLKISSNIASTSAIGAGALRVPTFIRYSRMKQLAETTATPYLSRSEFEGFAQSEGRDDLSVRGGTTIPPRKRSSNIVPPTAEELSAIPSFEEARKGLNGIRYNPGPTSSKEGPAGWEKVQTIEIVMLLRLYRSWGRELVINSAYRSEPVKASRSWHMSGQAFDVSMRGISSADRDRFVQLAREQGFGGIGRYSTFIHIDSGPVRQWSG